MKQASLLRLAERRGLEWDRVAFPGLLALVVALLSLTAAFGPFAAPTSLLVLPIVGGGLVLQRRRQLLAIVVAALVGILVVPALIGFSGVRPADVLIVLATGWV